MGTQDLSLDQEIEVAVFPSTTEPKNIFEEILDYTFVALVSMQVVAKGKFFIGNIATVSFVFGLLLLSGGFRLLILKSSRKIREITLLAGESGYQDWEMWEACLGPI